MRPLPVLQCRAFDGKFCLQNKTWGLISEDNRCSAWEGYRWGWVWDSIKINRLVTLAITPIRFLGKQQKKSAPPRSKTQWTLISPNGSPLYFASFGLPSLPMQGTPYGNTCPAHVSRVGRLSSCLWEGTVRQTVLYKSRGTLKPRIIQCGRKADSITGKEQVNKEINCYSENRSDI